MKLRRILLLICLVPLLAANVSAADVDDFLYSEVVFLRGIELGAGGRALALGGAYRALSDDLSALYWNPAGLASVRRIEMSLGLSQATTMDDATLQNETISNQLSRTRLNELGIVFPFPTYRGSLVFAVGYHQVQSFDAFGTFVDTGSEPEFEGDELESGSLGLWSLGMAIDISPAVSVGLSLRYWSGFNDYSYAEELNWETNDWYTYKQSLDLDLSGFNAITGIVARPYNWLRIGASLETPLRLKIKENWSSAEDANDLDYYSASGSYEYKLGRSFRGGLGAAVLLGPVIISSDIVVTDWSQTAFRSDPSFTAYTKEEANLEITRRLHPTIDLHFGTEVWIPKSPIRLQAGYARYPSPFEDDELITDKNVFSGGINVLLDQALLVQSTVSWTSWERSLYGWAEDLQMSHLLITLAYRF
ncbi:hypothetical protein KKA00_11720 [bacterium]|nr:hypothetical protein [bacterium]MBU1652882.1 hypothetical protein [bacterium]